MENFYEVFNINNYADLEEIKSAYLCLIKKYHPDHNIDDMENAERTTANLNEIYQILCDDEQKREYDKKLKIYLKENTKHTQTLNEEKGVNTETQDVKNESGSQRVSRTSYHTTKKKFSFKNFVKGLFSGMTFFGKDKAEKIKKQNNKNVDCQQKQNSSTSAMFEQKQQDINNLEQEKTNESKENIDTSGKRNNSISILVVVSLIVIFMLLLLVL